MDSKCLQCTKKCQTWGTVVVISAFMIQVVSFGIAVSIGMYNIALLEYYQSSVTEVSIIGAINIGLFLGGGIGFCLVYVPSHTLSGLYFDKHRSLITGLVTSGSGLGGAIFPVLFHYVILEYGWRGSMLIMAAVNMHNFVFSLLLRPAPIQSLGTKEEAIMLNAAANLHPPEPSSERLLEGPATSELDNEKLPNQELERETSQTPNDHGKQLKHCYVLSDFAFLIYWMSNLLWNMGSSIVIVLGPEFFTEIGLTKEEAALAIASYNSLIVVGGGLGGAIGNLRFINRIMFYTFCNIFTGIFTFILAVEYFHSFFAIAVDMALIGLAFGMILGLLVVVTADLLGIHSLGDGMGYLMLANGVGCSIGPPIGGAFRDHTYSYILSYYTAGAVTLLAGIVMFVIPIKNWICSREKT